jgi:hypothetical protein
MKIAFITEMGFEGKIPSDHTNMRTEFAWMHALDATHHSIYDITEVKKYDYVFVIPPKGLVCLNATGTKILDAANPVSDLLASNLVTSLKSNNGKVFIVQEGPHWWFNDYELVDQIHYYNMLTACDGIFAHNESDMKYYRGLVAHTPVYLMRSLMIEHSIQSIKPGPQDKVIVGGNFARWYGGFESFITAQEFKVPIWGQTSHAMRDGEDQLVQHLPRVMWTDWMKQLSTFKYAIHLMPTVAAGTFALNCAYLGIPCIGNIEVDTQKLCHPQLAVDVHDIEKARQLAEKLATDESFYKECSEQAKINYKKYYHVKVYKADMLALLKGMIDE